MAEFESHKEHPDKVRGFLHRHPQPCSHYQVHNKKRSLAFQRIDEKGAAMKRMFQGFQPTSNRIL